MPLQLPLDTLRSTFTSSAESRRPSCLASFSTACLPLKCTSLKTSPTAQNYRAASYHTEAATLLLLTCLLFPLSSYSACSRVPPLLRQESRASCTCHIGRTSGHHGIALNFPQNKRTVYVVWDVKEMVILI